MISHPSSSSVRCWKKNIFALLDELVLLTLNWINKPRNKTCLIFRIYWIFVKLCVMDVSSLSDIC